MYTFLTGVSLPYLDPSVPTVLSWLLSFLGEPLPLLIFWGDLLVFRFHDLGFFSAPQKSSILCQYFVLELLEILHPFSLVFFFHKPLFLSLLSCLGFCLFSCFLSYTLDITGFYCLFQVCQELLLLFIPLLHFVSLLFKYLSVILRNIRGNGRRHSDTKKGKKIFFLVYVLLT